MVRTNQGGSILGFVIIGGVMAVLLIGGAYIVRHNLASIADDTSEVMEDELGSDQPTETDSTDLEEGDVDQTEEDEGGSQRESEPETSQSVESASSNDHHQEADPDSSSPENLPQTGPGDAVLAGLMLSGMVGVCVAYVRSRASSVSL